MRELNLFCSAVVFGIVMLAGCGSKPTSDFTHLWVGDETQNVWTYERAVVVDHSDDEDPKPNEFLKHELLANQEVMLSNGKKIVFDGTVLRIGKRVIKATHVHVESNGSIRENAFIRDKR